MNAGKLLIATDLDGTLLDHDDYSFAPAVPTLARIRACAIPLLLNTSKTFAELLPLRRAMEHEGPFVVENGSALYLPKGVFSSAPRGVSAVGDYWRYPFGIPYRDILATLATLRERFRFAGFSDWDAAAVAAATGLDEAQAVLAGEREYSEPLQWLDDPEALPRFEDELNEAGLQTLRGGRFLHVLGKTDKGRGLELFRRWHAVDTATSPQVVALGDSENDAAMLAVADIAVWIARPGGDPPRISPAGRLVTSTAFGPAGWSEVVDGLLDEFGYPGPSTKGVHHG